MDSWHVAQVNVARLLAPLDAPEIADFVANLDPVNAIAEQSPGYVWRLQDDSGNATSITVDPDPLIIMNMSVWESIESLEAFVRNGAHVAIMRRRREFFERAAEAYLALRTRLGLTHPTPRARDARSRVAHLRDVVLPVHLAPTAHHEQIARTGHEVARTPTTTGSQQERAPAAQGEDRDTRVLELAQLSIAVPGDAVVPVAVVVESDTEKGHLVAPFERGLHGRERGVGQRFGRRIPTRQARVVDHALVHPTFPLRPGHGCHERVEQRVGAPQPVARDVDPTPIVEVEALEGRARIDLGLAPTQQGALLDGHGNTVANVCSSQPEDDLSAESQAMLSQTRFTEAHA
jgi:hypothetical protein